VTAPEPSADVLVRPATPADAPAAVRTLLASRHAAERSGAIPVDSHDDTEVESWFCERVMATREVWVAEQDGTCVGVLVLDEAWLDHLYVLPAWTGRGIGSLLLATARALRPAGFDLWVFQTNTAAQGFYEQHGLESPPAPTTTTISPASTRAIPRACTAVAPAQHSGAASAKSMPSGNATTQVAGTTTCSANPPSVTKANSPRGFTQRCCWPFRHQRQRAQKSR